MRRIHYILIYPLVAVLFGCFFPSLSVWAQIAQSVGIASSPNPVGSGARALGMGGAFIGVADDATAASWNPAGLIQLETPEISIVGAYNHRTEDSTYTAFPEASGPQQVSTCELNYLSAAYPFSLFDRNMIVSLNYQHLYDFNKKVRFSNSIEGPTDRMDNHFKFEQEGALRAISPAFAVQILPELSLGVTLNFWEDALYDNEWKLKRHQTGSGSIGGIDFSYREELVETYRMSGFNFNLGVLWNINSTFSMGAVFKAPFRADLDHDYHSSYSWIFPSSPEMNQDQEIDFTESETLDMPMSYGIGLAVRLSDTLTLAFDIYRTEWGDYVMHTEDGGDLSPITGKPENESDIDATTQVRLGGEYLIIGERTVIPVRAGLFYDPEPAHGSPDDFWGVSVGTGIAYKSIVYDLAYQYRFGNDVRSAIVGEEDATQDVEQHTLYMSLIYHF
jgi:long-subunit fatty acid transport protein